MDRVYRLGYDAHLFRCAACGHETMDAHGISFEMLVLDAAPRQRRKHKCGHCGAPMPQLDERTYGVGSRRPET